MGERERRIILASKLASRQATVIERDEALAEILLSLWSHEDLDKMIDDKITVCKERRGCSSFSLSGILKAIAGAFSS